MSWATGRENAVTKVAQVAVAAPGLLFGGDELGHGVGHELLLAHLAVTDEEVVHDLLEAYARGEEAAGLRVFLHGKVERDGVGELELGLQAAEEVEGLRVDGAVSGRELEDFAFAIGELRDDEVSLRLGIGEVGKAAADALIALEVNEVEAFVGRAVDDISLGNDANGDVALGDFKGLGGRFGGVSFHGVTCPPKTTQS